MLLSVAITSSLSYAETVVNTLGYIWNSYKILQGPVRSETIVEGSRTLPGRPFLNHSSI